MYDFLPSANDKLILVCMTLFYGLTLDSAEMKYAGIPSNKVFCLALMCLFWFRFC